MRNKKKEFNAVGGVERDIFGRVWAGGIHTLCQICKQPTSGACSHAPLTYEQVVALGGKTCKVDPFETVVLFRRKPGEEALVVALFPEEPADVHAQRCACYERVEEHFSIDANSEGTDGDLGDSEDQEGNENIFACSNSAWSFLPGAGRFGSGDCETIMRETTPATPEEYAKLFTELEALGYRMTIGRMSPKICTEQGFRSCWASRGIDLPAQIGPRCG